MSIRIRVIDILIYLAIGLAITVIVVIVSFKPNSLFLNSILITLMTFIISSVLLEYLNRKKKPTNKLTLRGLSREIDGLRTVLRKISKENIVLDEDKIKAYVAENLETGIIKKLNKTFGEEILKRKKREAFFNNLYRSEERLDEEIINTSRRANLNLVIGILSTAFGISAFGYIIYKTPQETSDLVGYFLPRVFLVVFTQVFAYFFLRLYKKGIEDIKYYQNELTAIETKLSAIEYSMLIPDNTTIQTTIITHMMNNERNTVISNDSTTNAIEMEKLNKVEGLETLMDIVKEGLKSRAKSE